MKLQEVEQIRKAHASSVGESHAANAVSSLCDEVVRLRVVLMDIRDARPSQKWQADKIDAALST